MDAIKKNMKQIDELINPLITFIDYHLDPSEEDSLESKTKDSVAKGTKIADNIIELATSTVKCLGQSHCLSEVANSKMRIKLLEVVNAAEGWGKPHLLFLGSAAAALTIEKCVAKVSVELKCWEFVSAVLELAKYLKFFREEIRSQRKILDLPENLTKFRKEMSRDKEEIVKNAVTTIVEGAVMCCDYIETRNMSSFWFPTTVAEQLAKTRDSIHEVMCYLYIRRQNRDLAKQFTHHLERPSLNLLGFLPCEKGKIKVCIPARM